MSATGTPLMASGTKSPDGGYAIRFSEPNRGGDISALTASLADDVCASAGVPDSERFVPVGAGELAEPVPPMRWLIRDVWPEHSFGPMGGEKKTLKTYNLMAMAVAVASGKPLFGQFEVVSPGPVLYYVGEGGQRSFQRRLQAVCAAYKVNLADLPIHAVFEVGSLAGAEFTAALARNLDAIEPALVVVDPLYAFHPPGIEAQNLYERGRMLAELSGAVAGKAALVVADHFKKSGGAELDLDSISQAGMGQWADSWILQKHRVRADLANGLYQLGVEFGSRQWGGGRWDIDWNLPARGGPEDEDEAVSDELITWAVVPSDGSAETSAKSEGSRRSLHDRIERVLADHPFEFTASALAAKVGGNRDKLRVAIADLKDELRIEERSVAREEGSRSVKRKVLGMCELPGKFVFNVDA
ncbi:AAA family ATPase [Rhodococcus qingshengii]|uniref:AAA family ATPase n=1 Tax=Rhodococcus qingshengii TaxID=334542 RepID=UPI0024BAA886|nr:AAA family ATPase [Rhodococcus qingshengii]MDJ0440614.1 AAA family ATPase [Rhodococcus qingshengii]